ncbi:hypothetical protein [Aestuariibius sp. HNIBRBA575]|uniref:hypothetical protein n=1 Tax=Aestuariibius sp. HNIBRBA575 TaxID=3233343 RepID=UPI0034A567B4
MRRFVTVCIAAMSLTGCGGLDLGKGLADLSLLSNLTADDGTARGIQTLSLFDGDISLRGPDGYCIDRSASRTDTGFVVVAACARVSDAELLPSLDGFLTYQVGEPDTAIVNGSESSLADLMETEAGQALLAQSGLAEDVEIIETQFISERVFVRFTDTSAPDIEGMDASMWRAFLDVNNRLVTINLRPITGTDMSSWQGKSLIQSAADVLSDANRAESVLETIPES